MVSSRKQTPPARRPVALVTGASGGLGPFVIDAFRDAGYRVSATGLKWDAPARGADHVSEADLSIERAAKDVVRQTEKAVVADNPFPNEAKNDPGHLLVVVLKDAPDRAAVAALQKAIKGREVVKAKGRQAYIVYPDGVGHSKLTMTLIEKTLGTRGTGRNWNTVLKLRALTA